MDENCPGESVSDGLQGFLWKEPINGKTAFFTEEVYRQLAGPEPTLEERASNMLDALGFAPLAKEFNDGRSDSSGGHTSYSKAVAASGSCSVQADRPCPFFPTPQREEAKSSLRQNAPAAEVEEKVAIRLKEEEPAVFVSPNEDPPMDVPDTPASPDPQEEILDRELSRDAAFSKPSEVLLTPKADVSMPSSSASRSSAAVPETDQAGILSHPQPECRLQVQGESGVEAVVDSAHQLDRKSDFPGAHGQSQHSANRGRTFNKGKRPPAPEARKSSLSHDQHIRYLDLFTKFTKRFFCGNPPPPSAREVQELKEFEKLQVLVAREQEECQTYLKQLALHNPYLYTSLPPHVAKYTQEKEQNGWKRAESYARYYNPHSRLPLTVPSQPGPNTPALRLLQTLVQLGAKCRLVMPDQSPNPNARLKRTVPTDIEKITARFPPLHASSQHSSLTWNHEAASKDSNMETLVQKYPCHIATSASVLQQLLDNHAPDFSVAWDIPVVIRNHGSGPASGKVVYLDKPLLPRGLSQCQRKTQYLQKALRAFLCQPLADRKTASSRSGGMTPKGQPQGSDTDKRVEHADVSHSRAPEEDDDDDPFGTAVSMDDLETFGSDKLSSQSSKKLPSLKPDASDVGWSVRSVKRTLEGKAAADKESSTEVPQLSAQTDGAEANGELEAESVKRVSESIMTTETEAGSESEAGMGIKLEPADGQQEASSGRSPAKRCLRSSALLAQDASSDSEDDALVIALPDSREKGLGSSSKPSQSQQRSMGRRSKDSKSSIFDEMPASTAPVSEDSEKHGQVNPLMTRRMTRSSSQRLQSPDKASMPAPEEAPLRTTRQGSKRRLHDLKAEAEVGIPVVENPASTKKSQRAGGEVDSSERDGHTSAKKAKKTAGGAVNSESDCQASSRKAVKPAGGADHPEADGPRATKPVDEPLSRESHSARVKGQAGVSHPESASEQQARRRGDQPGTKNPAGAASTPLDSILKEMMPPGDSTVLKFEEDPSLYRQPGCTGEHIGYHLWDLSGVSVMVRCNNHCFIRDMRQQQKVVYVRAKPERQVHHGLEQTTLSESVHAWLGCYLRPNSYLLRARVNMQTHEIVHMEELQLNQILQPTLNFSPPHAFAVMRNIFTTLMELPVGSYLLSHESGADHVQLKAATGTKRGGYDLRCHYMGLGVMKETDKTVPWVPVDPTLMLPNHWRLGLIPATFQPPDFDPKRKKQQHFVMPKKKNRSRKKRQN